MSLEIVSSGLRSGSAERWLNYLRRRAKSPEFIIALLLVVALSFLVLVPVFNLTSRTLSWTESDARISPDAVPGRFTLNHWQRLLFGRLFMRMLWEPLSHTLVTGGIAAGIALLLGSMLAWLVTRTNLPGRGWLRSVLYLPFIIPAFALAIAWETLFKSPLAGGRPGVFQSLFGVVPPTWLSYGPVPIIITMIVHFYPFAFILVSGALVAVDAQLEEGARLLGASNWMIIRKIIFPMITPALLSAFVLTFGRTVGTFAIPYFLGGPVRYDTLSTMIFRNLSMGLDVNGYILAIILILLTSLVLYLNSRLLGGSSRRFEIIGGKGFKTNITSLGQWRWPIFLLVGAFALITVVLPIGLLAYQSLMLVDGCWELDNLTLHYWLGRVDPDLAFGSPGLFRNAVVLGGAWNSIRLAVLGSFICAMLGVLIGYFVVRNSRSWISRFLDQVSFLPFLFPAIAFGAMYLSMFAVQRGPIPALYGTFTLLVLVSVIHRLPYSTRTGASAVAQIGQELEETAELQGASWLKRFYHIVLPLARSGVVSGMMLTFIGIMRELAAIILLYTPSTRVLMTVAYRFAEEDIPQLSNALILLVTVITILGQLVVWRLGQGRLARLQERKL